MPTVSVPGSPMSWGLRLGGLAFNHEVNDLCSGGLPLYSKVNALVEAVRLFETASLFEAACLLEAARLLRARVLNRQNDVV